jgi:hypothetical protein
MIVLRASAERPQHPAWEVAESIGFLALNMNPANPVMPPTNKPIIGVQPPHFPMPAKDVDFREKSELRRNEREGRKKILLIC